jgi:hypothetical protein
MGTTARLYECHEIQGEDLVDAQRLLPENARVRFDAQIAPPLPTRPVRPARPLDARIQMPKSPVKQIGRNELASVQKEIRRRLRAQRARAWFQNFAPVIALAFSVATLATVLFLVR